MDLDELTSRAVWFVIIPSFAVVLIRLATRPSRLMLTASWIGGACGCLGTFWIVAFPRGWLDYYSTAAEPALAPLSWLAVAITLVHLARAYASGSVLRDKSRVD